MGWCVPGILLFRGSDVRVAREGGRGRRIRHGGGRSMTVLRGGDFPGEASQKSRSGSVACYAPLNRADHAGQSGSRDLEDN